MQQSGQSDGFGARSNPEQSSGSMAHHHVASSYGIRRTFADDSWIEVSSRPSSSSLSSAAEEIITTGLRVQHDSAGPRRRRRHSDRPMLSRALSNDVEDSQQEDSEEVMDSSADEKQPVHVSSTRSSVGAYASGEASSSESDENATAIGGVSPNQPFVPRPNTFSLQPNTARPPEPQHASHPGYNAPTRPYRAAQRHSYPSQPHQHTPFSAIAPSHTVDHDAALRASLSTLLSYANAARSLPKNERAISAGNTQIRPAGGNRIDVATLGLVPESTVLGGAIHNAAAQPNLHLKVESDTTAADSKKTKRKSESRSSSKDRDRSRSKKQARRSNAVASLNNTLESVNPTLLTWVVGAGMIVLVSAISFSAGYVVGRETGAGSSGGAGFGGDAIPTGGSNAEYLETVASLGSGLSGNVPSGGSGMKRNLASKGSAAAAHAVGLGWGRNAVVGAS